MLPLLSLACALGPNPIPMLDQFAVARDKGGLIKLAAPGLIASRPHVFDFLTSGGSYGVGRFGWHVYALNEVGSGLTLAVFDTPLTCEDMGEQVFQWDGQRLLKYIPEAETFGVRILDQHLAAHFEVQKSLVSIEDTVLFERSQRAKSFLFRLGDDYVISSISDEHGHAVPFRWAGGVVSVGEPDEGDRFSYRIAYQGVVNRPQYAGSISEKEIILSQDYWYPTVGRAPSPYSLDSYTPIGWKVIGQGVELGQKEEGGFTKTSFRMDLPVVFYSFSAAPFQAASDKIGPWPFTAYAMNIGPEQLHVENAVQSDVIDFYNKTFSPYPFPTWATVISAAYGGGALEAYSYATYGSDPGEDAHEPSHTWWGGILPNSYLKSQWNESFAVFSEGFFQRERDLGNRVERRQAFISDPAPDNLYEQGTVENDPPELGPAVGSLGYGKGSAVLQMLQDEIGTQNFLDSIHEWIRSHPKGTLAEWDEFEAAVNRVMAADYGWFFSEWLRRPGWADFDISNVHWADGMLTGHIAFKGDPYRLTMEVMAQEANGKRNLKKFAVKGSGDFEVPFKDKPALASFDPWHRLLRTYNASENPVSIRSFLAGAKRYTQPHSDWFPFAKNQTEELGAMPSDLSGVLLVGSPLILTAMQPLLDQAGFSLEGNQLTYDGTTIDLNNGSALAVIDLPNGGHCGIALGKTILEPNFGRSRICLVDRYGRFLRGMTEPKTRGGLTFRL